MLVLVSVQDIGIYDIPTSEPNEEVVVRLVDSIYRWWNQMKSFILSTRTADHLPSTLYPKGELVISLPSERTTFNEKKIRKRCTLSSLSPSLISTQGFSFVYGPSRTGSHSLSFFLTFLHPYYSLRSSVRRLFGSMSHY